MYVNFPTKWTVTKIQIFFTRDPDPYPIPRKFLLFRERWSYTRVYCSPYLHPFYVPRDVHIHVGWERERERGAQNKSMTCAVAIWGSRHARRSHMCCCCHGPRRPAGGGHKDAAVVSPGHSDGHDRKRNTPGCSKSSLYCLLTSLFFTPILVHWDCKTSIRLKHLLKYMHSFIMT